MKQWLERLTPGKRRLAKALILTIVATLPFYCLGVVALMAMNWSDSARGLFKASLPLVAAAPTATVTRTPTATSTPAPARTSTSKPSPTNTPLIAIDGREVIKNFPVLSGFQLKDSGSRDSGGEKLYSATWQGKSNVKGVLEFYRKVLPSQGWKEITALGSSDEAVLSYTKEPSLSAIITIQGKDKNELEISVVLAVGRR